MEDFSIGKFRYYITKVKKTKDKKGRNLLQFTRGWKFDHIVPHGDEIDYCLASVSDGQLKWNPPLNYFGGGRKQFHAMETATYNAILSCLQKSKHIGYLMDGIEAVDLEEESIKYDS